MLLLLLILFHCCTEKKNEIEEDKEFIEILQESNAYLEEDGRRRAVSFIHNLDNARLINYSNALELIYDEIRTFEEDLSGNLSDTSSVLSLEKQIKKLWRIELNPHWEFPELNERLLKYRESNKGQLEKGEMLLNGYFKYKIDLIRKIASSFSICSEIRYDPELDIKFNSRKIKEGDTLKVHASLKVVKYYTAESIKAIEKQLSLMMTVWVKLFGMIKVTA